MVVLEQQRPDVADLRLVAREDAVAGGAINFGVILHQHAVLEGGDERGRRDFAVMPEGGRKDDVVGLPLARRPAGVDERRVLGINRGGLGVRVGCVVIGNAERGFLESPQEDADVAPGLCSARGARGQRTLPLGPGTSHS